MSNAIFCGMLDLSCDGTITPLEQGAEFMFFQGLSEEDTTVYTSEINCSDD
jgi:hypothetical protein